MAQAREPRLCGGVGAEKDGSSPEVEAALEAVKPHLESKHSESFESMTVVSYREQTVAGKNYFITMKAKTTDQKERVIRLKVYMNLAQVYELLESELVQESVS